MKWFRLLFVLSLCTATFAEKLCSEDEVAKQMGKYLKKSQTLEEVEDFKKIVQMISFPSYLYKSSVDMFSSSRVSILCLTCRSMLNSLLEMFNEGATMQELAEKAINLCVTLRIQPEHTCRGIVELHAELIWYLFKNNLINPKSVCGVLYQVSDFNACPYDDERYEWSVDLPEKLVEQKVPIVSKSNTTFRIAHVSDVHYDPLYVPGGQAVCDELLCCRRSLNSTIKSSRWRPFTEDSEAVVQSVHTNDNGAIVIDLDYADRVEPERALPNVDSGRETAGYWGDYRDCDTPWWALEDGLDHIAGQPNIDYVYFTGDVIDHAVWETTQDAIEASLKRTFEKLKATFKDIPVYPVIGNHESQPVNQFANVSIVNPMLSTTWLYNLLSDLWSAWLPKDTMETIQKGGYYTTLVRPGFRIVALNTNLCYIFNVWIHHDPADPSAQFSWLVETLEKAERAGEKVHILSHIPTGKSSLFRICTREYARILRRFSDIIVAEFNGHTHKDEFKVYYKDNDTNAFAVAWNGGSLTTYSNVNLNYRIYEVQDDTFDLIDVETWIYNLTEANLSPDKRPRWFMEYSFKEYYGLESVAPEQVDRLINRMVNAEKDLMQKYQRLRGKSSDVFGLTCNNICVKSNLCYMARMEVYDDKKCNELWEIYKENNID